MKRMVFGESLPCSFVGLRTLGAWLLQLAAVTASDIGAEAFRGDSRLVLAEVVVEEVSCSRVKEGMVLGPECTLISFGTHVFSVVPV